MPARPRSFPPTATPHGLEEYRRQRGSSAACSVIIAGAGGAAHLPGVTAAFTTLPVIGVPIETKSLKGMDSLLSIVQMPPGVPVATVGINAARNAGLLAVQILAVSDDRLQKGVDGIQAEACRRIARKEQKPVLLTGVNNASFGQSRLGLLGSARFYESGKQRNRDGKR